MKMSVSKLMMITSFIVVQSAPVMGAAKHLAIVSSQQTYVSSKSIQRDDVLDQTKGKHGIDRDVAPELHITPIITQRMRIHRSQFKPLHPFHLKNYDVAPIASYTAYSVDSSEDPSENRWSYSHIIFVSGLCVFCTSLCVFYFVKPTHSRRAINQATATLEIEDETGITTYPISSSNGPIWVGRDNSMDICLLDDMISRTHAAIYQIRNRFIIIDAASSNGTRVNDCQIHYTEIHDGDCIKIGQTRMFFRAVYRTRIPSKSNHEVIYLRKYPLRMYL